MGTSGDATDEGIMTGSLKSVGLESVSDYLPTATTVGLCTLGLGFLFYKNPDVFSDIYNWFFPEKKSPRKSKRRNANKQDSGDSDEKKNNAILWGMDTQT